MTSPRTVAALLSVLLACLARRAGSFPLVPPALVHLGIGAGSGAAGAVVAYPIDLVKSRLQTESGRAAHGSDGLGAALDIVRSSPLGPLALYRGCLVQVAGVAPEKTIKLAANDAARAYIMAHAGALTVGGEVAAGAVAGFCQVIVTNPLEVVKLKMQTSGAGYGLGDVLEEVGGFLGMYRGVLCCLARDVTFSAVLFPGFSHLKAALPPLAASALGHEVDPIVTGLLAGGIAAAPAAFIGTPFDVVKTRMQQAREEREACELRSDDFRRDACADEEDSLADILRQLSGEGYQVFFSGWYERCLRSCVQFGVTLSLFEVLNTKAVESGLF